ncbi:hypothetical protein [Metabacillus sediminilitoris]|uniref:hypothetical protein n=2 Tax=Metabacillus sediminilitoris TaxID=2567941 RepID=UPI001454D2B6|nr:hypothetical protein [Metabacillus sediminilitoris]
MSRRMMIVKIKTKKGLHFSVPVPYFIINGCISLICSRVFWNGVKRMTNHHPKASVWIPETLDKNTLSVLVASLKAHKGVTIVDVDLKDNMKVKVIL